MIPPVFSSRGLARYQILDWIRNEKMVGFFLIGVVAYLIDIGLLYVFCAYLGIWYLLAATVSYCCGIVASYLLNKYLNFHDTDRHYLAQFSTFTAIAFSCLLVNLSVIWPAVEIFSLNYLAGKIIATLCAFFWNYHWQKHYTFRGGE
ncbi:MAG: GtrA family protein [Methanoregula sp.]|jgi:putative flippase GtrA